jgi:hypothetical protein
MKKIFLTFLFLLFAISAFNQSNRCSYELRENIGIRNFNTYTLIIVNDSNYILRLGCLLVDEVHYNYISYGNYINIRNKIICKDKINGFEIELIKFKDSCYVKRGPSFIKNKYLKYLNYSSWFDIVEDFKKIDSVYGLKKDYIPKTDSTFVDKLVMGEYLCDWLTKLYILPFNKYELKIDTVIVSKGKWTQDKNKIIFYDKSLKHSFVAEIVDKAIVNLKIPIDLSNSKYKLHKKWKK